MKIKEKKITAVILTAILTASALAGCAQKDNHRPEDSKENPMQNEQQESLEQDGSIPADQLPADQIMEGEDAMSGEDGNAFGKFRPSELGVAVQEKYEYPYMGLTASLDKNLLEKMAARDVIMLTSEEYTADGLKYAMLHWYALTEEQKNEEVEAFDPAVWTSGLAKIGTLGVCSKEAAASLDEITGCTEHKELGKSEDDAYTYYLSYAKEADADLKKELENTETSLSPMEKLDLSMGDTAFSEARVETSSLGEFTARDVNGKEYTKEMFKDYDLTLVNVFATWCSPCIREMPELEKLKKEMEAKGINVAAVVFDTVSDNGEIQEENVETAKLLAEKAGLTFPLLMPDETELNGRLKGIKGFPESFFVDKNGNIVGETYAGAHTFEEWKEIAGRELANLKGAE